jgi:hypothetical protein
MARYPSLVALLLAVACDGSPTRRESLSAAALPQWRLDSVPLYVLGGPAASPAEIWTNFGDVARFDSGTLIIGDTYTGEVRLFDRSGKHVQTLGGRGDGPGEFREMWGVYLAPDDTVWAIDNPTGRIHAFKDGTYQRTMRIERIGLAGMMGSRPVGLATKPPTGPVDALGRPRRDPGLIRDAAYLLVQDEHGNDADTLAEVLRSESYLSTARNWETPLLARSSYIAVGRNFVAKGDGADTLVVVFGARGDTLGILPVAAITGEAFSKLVEARRASRLAQGRTAEEIAAIKAMLDQMPPVDRITDITALVAGADGNIWVRRVFLPQDSVAEWRVFSASGTAVASARIPVGYRLRHISGDEVIVSYRDDTDVTRVALFRILR